MSNYCTKQDVIRHWGAANVNAWADIENTESASAIDAQIEWAIEAATLKINSDLNASIYEVPFPATPAIVRFYAASLAGCFLFKCRMIAATEDRGAAISKAETDYQAWVVAVFSGTPIEGANLIAAKGGI